MTNEDHRDTLRVGIVEDDRPFRESVRMLISGTPGFTCVGAWRSLEDALGSRAGEEPDVMLLDIQLPGTQGDQGVESLRRKFPSALVLMLTAHADDEKIFASLCRGACGYLLKGTPPAMLLQAIREAADGGSPMSPVIARKVVTLVRRTAVEVPLGEDLTERETQVLALLADGKSYQAAADDLGISINTLRNYIRSIYEKLQVHSRSEAVGKAIRGRLI